MRDGDGTLRDRRPAREESLEEVLGKKRSGYTLRMARNGIPAKTSGDKLFRNPLACPGFYTSGNSWGIANGHILRRLPGERPGGFRGRIGVSRARHRAQGGHGDFRQGFGGPVAAISKHPQDYPHLLRKAREAVRFTPSLFTESIEGNVNPESAARIAAAVEEHRRSISEKYPQSGQQEKARQAAEADAASREEALQRQRRQVRSIKNKCNRGMLHTVKWEEIDDPKVYVGVLKSFFSELRPPAHGQSQL